MSGSLRIAFDIAALGQGGMERQLVDVAIGLARRGHEPIVIVNKRISAYQKQVDAADVRAFSLGHDSRFDPRVVRDITRCLRSTRSEVVVGVNFNATALSRVAARLVGIPAVTAEHSIRSGSALGISLSNRLLAPQTSTVIACAEAQYV